MTKYTPLKAILAYVSPSLRKTTDDDTLLDHAINAYRHFDLPSRWERKIAVLPVTNGNVALPSDWRRIVRVTWWAKQPCLDENLDLCAEPEEPIDETTLEDTDTIGEPCSTVYYRAWENSYLYCHGELLQYKGNARGIFCKDCPNPNNMTCRSYYTLNGNDTMIVQSHLDGWVCFDYFGEIYENGCPMIPDDEPLKQGLALYAESQVARDRSWMKEEGMYQLYNDSLAKAEILLRKFKGRQVQQNIDIEKIRHIDGRNLVYLYFRSVWR